MMLQLSIFDLLEAVETESDPLCDRCGWGHDDPAHCLGAADQTVRITPTQGQLKQAVLSILWGPPGLSAESLELNLKSDPWLFDIDPSALSIALNELYNSGRILKTTYSPNDEYKRKTMYWVLPDASREWKPESDLASDFDVLFGPDPEPEITPPVSTADELADLQAKVSRAKALAEKNQQLQSEKAVIESELSDLERQLEQIFSGGYNEFADIEAAKIQREIEVRQRCRREIMAHFESPDSIVPAWSKWQDRIDEILADHPDLAETESKEPESESIVAPPKPKRTRAKKAKAESVSLADLADRAGDIPVLTPSPEQEVLEPEPVKPAKKNAAKPAVKPVKADQIGSVTPTLGQLSEAVLEILSRDPHFASREMLDLALPGAHWLFNTDTDDTREMLTGVLSGLMDNGVIEFFSTENGLFLRLATLSTPKHSGRLEIVLKDPVCIYCGTNMQTINGNLGQWRCLHSVMHSFYVSNGRGVWVDNSGTFDKQITELPSWAKKEG